MNSYCGREAEVADAIRTGTIHPEILGHAQTCPVCSEVLLVGTFLHDTQSLSVNHESALPDSDVIWRRAQALRRDKTIATATRPIRVVTIIAWVVVAVFLTWAGAENPFWGFLAGWWSKSFELLAVALQEFWLPVSSTSILVGFAGTAVILALSSWYLLRES